MSFIVTKNMTKDYQLGKTTVNALRGLDIEIKKGEYKEDRIPRDHQGCHSACH